ncbi:unnamed protein product [Soboliphyme baturini]|uniref:Uncharacterized protein n=1 Tax=Soboliphyme baturini TaxID=241478 RepID=A0A183IAN9_9BILA|nr:unnamed protein product [Soboliphyme baturini]
MRRCATMAYGWRSKWAGSCSLNVRGYISTH